MPFDWTEYLKFNPDLKMLANATTAWYHWRQHGLQEGRQYIAPDSPRVLKIFLITKDEPDLLEDWIVYHQRLVGYHNLYIIDNYSTDPLITKEIYPRYQALGVNIILTDSDLNQRAQFMSQEMLKVLPDCDFLIKMDTDEFLALRHNGRVSTDPYHLQEYLKTLPVDGRIYKASYVTTPAYQPRPASSIDYWWPAQQLTDFKPLEKTDMKSFFSHSFSYCDLGAHRGRVLASYDHLPPLETDLVWIHLHKTTFGQYIAKARSVLYSHGYICPRQSPVEQLRTLKKLKEVPDLRSSHKIDIYYRYLTGELTEKQFYTPPKVIKTLQRDRSSMLSINLFSWVPVFPDRDYYVIYCPDKQLYWYVDLQHNLLKTTPDRQRATQFIISRSHNQSIYRYSFQIVFLPQDPDNPLVDDQGNPGRHIFATPEAELKTDGNNREWANFYIEGTPQKFSIQSFLRYRHGRGLKAPEVIGHLYIADGDDPRDRRILPNGLQGDNFTLYKAGDQKPIRWTIESAIIQGNLSMVKKLLKSRKQLPELIKLAIQKEQWDIYQYLLDTLQDPEPSSESESENWQALADEWTLEEAVDHGNLEVLKGLLTELSDSIQPEELLDLTKSAIRQQQWETYHYLLDYLQQWPRSTKED